MIFYLASWSNRMTVDRYLASWGWDQWPKLQPMTYERFLAQRSYRPGVYVFSDLELLSEEVRQHAGRAWDVMRREGGPYILLNQPTRSMRRFELLETLYVEGVNSFRIHRINGDLTRVRFPVFLPICDDHIGSRSELLRSADELAAAIGALRTKGTALDGWIVVEFCDTADSEGFYQKYSAFRIGPHLLARHLLTSRKWCLKYNDDDRPKSVRDEWTYFTTNPHRDQLLEIFDRAHIEFGRIDYGLLNGRIQGWEINTNPMLPAAAIRKELPRLPVHRAFVHQLAEAWSDLDRRVPAHAAYPGERLRTAWRVANEFVGPHVRRVFRR